MAGRSADSDDASSRHATVSDTTPLLQSETSSRTRGSSRTSSPSAAGASSPKPTDLDEPNVRVSRRRAVAIAISVYTLIFLQASNMSGMTTAQSTIAADLDAYEEAMWFTSAYLIAMASFGPLAGRLAAIFSPRAIILATSCFFVVGGLVSSQARSLPVFLLGRVLSGTGGAGMLVLSMILVLELTSKRQRGLFIGLVNSGFTTGVSLGAVLFGALIPVTGWRFLFWIQSPIGAVAALGVYFSLPKGLNPENRVKGTPTIEKLKKIDYLGAFLLTATIVLFLYGLSGSIRIIPILVSLGTLVSFVAVEYLVAANPIVPISVLQSRGTLLSCLSQLGMMTARWTVLFYAPVTALAVFGLSAGASGSMLIPTNVGFGLGGLLVGWLHVRRTGSFWAACLVSIALFTATLAGVAAAAQPRCPTPLYMAALFANGLCTGAALNYTLAHLLHLTAPPTHYVATSLLGTFRGFAGSFGTAVGGGIFARALRAGLEAGFRAADGVPAGQPLDPARAELVKRLVGSPALVHGGDLSSLEQRIAVQGYVGALSTLFHAMMVLSVVVLAVQAATGRKGPKDQVEDPEEVRVAVEEHDREFEA